MHKIDSREISNRKYLSKTILPLADEGQTEYLFEGQKGRVNTHNV